jgi:hypothetical protein
MLEDVDCLCCENESTDVTKDGQHANTFDPGCFEVGYEYVLTCCYVLSIPIVTVFNKK